MLASSTRRGAVTAAVGLTALALAACGSSDSGLGNLAGPATASDAAQSPTAPRRSKVTLTQGSKGDECQLDHTKAAAGPVTFTVTNKDATSITEVELVSDQRIIGEKENLAPGLAAVSFT